MKGFLFCSILIVIFLQGAWAQTEDNSSSVKVREVKMNMSGLLTQIIPFSSSNVKTGPYDVTWLSGKDDRYFRISLGARIIPDFFNEITNAHLNLAVGYTRRSSIWKQFYYDRSIMAMGYAGSLNFPGVEADSGSGLGIGFGFGPGYKISDKVNISTELILFIGAGEVFQVAFIPPVAVNLAMRI